MLVTLLSVSMIQSTSITSDLLNKLNEQQYHAVTTSGRPLLIVAGAGSGKTMVLTHKIAYMILNGLAESDAILAITFTNKAAKEMKERVARLVPNVRQPYISTFHALCADLLRREFHHLGWTNQFIIFDASDQTRLIKQILKSKNIDDKKYTASYVMSVIEGLKNQLIGVPKYLKGTSDNYDPTIAIVYEDYQKQLFQNQAVDFTDLLFWAVKLFVSAPEVLVRYQQRFRHILVDEYQDTNYAQYYLIRLLISDNPNLVVVGDFDQNIYSWRGADIRNILNFEKDFPNAEVVLLEQNYRSTKVILQAANGLIRNNAERRDKNLWTQNEQGEPLTWCMVQDERQEAQYIAQEILARKQAGTLKFEDFVILYRTNAQSRVLEDMMAQKSIPYKVIGTLKYFERAEIKDILAYLRLVHNPHDNLAFTRVANVPVRGVGDTTLRHLMEMSAQTEKSIATLVLSGEPLPVQAKALSAIRSFFTMITEIRTRMVDEQLDLSAIIDAVQDRSGYRQMLKEDQDIKAVDRLENIMELLSMVRGLEESLPDFLDRVTMATEKAESEEEAVDSVTLMTMHNAKGLEFDYVFIAGWEEGILPHYRSKNDESALGEERRLAYVGITRGRKKVWLTACRERFLFGDTQMNKVSRFIAEIPDHTYRAITWDATWGSQGTGIGGPVFDVTSSQKTFKKAFESSFEKGEKVRHAQWGIGTILRIDGEGESAMIHASFGVEIKKMMAKYAPLEKLPV